MNPSTESSVSSSYTPVSGFDKNISNKRARIDVEHIKIIGIGAFKSESTYDKTVVLLDPTWHTANANERNKGGKYSVVE